MNAPLVINHSVQQLADNFDLIVERVRSESQMHDIDLSKSSDRKKVIAAAHKVTKTKTELASRIKDAISSINNEIAPQIELINKLKSSNKIISAQLSSLKDEIREPVTAWERAEQERIDNHQLKLKLLTSLVFDCDSQQLKKQKEQIERINTDDMQELELAAYKAKAESIKQLDAAINTAQRREKEAAEQVRLEKEAAAKAVEIAAAKAEAERKKRDERIAHEARLNAEREAKQRVINAERRAKEAEAAAHRAKEEERERQLKEIAQAEQERIKRKNDQMHLLEIKNHARLDIERVTGLDEETAYMIVNAIASGSVRNLTLEV